MRTFELNKLVRDEVYEDMMKIGQIPDIRVITDDEEFLSLLQAKLEEETAELAAKDSDKEKETAQIDAVREQIEYVKDGQKEKVGAFASRIFITLLNLEDEDPWVEYYAKQPDRFPEVIHEPYEE